MSELAKHPTDWKISEYKERLSKMTDDELVQETASMVLMDAQAARFCVFSVRCDATYDEAGQRGKPHLYQRGWNQAFKSQGHVLSERDIKGALAPA